MRVNAQTLDRRIQHEPGIPNSPMALSCHLLYGTDWADSLSSVDILRF